MKVTHTSVPRGPVSRLGGVHNTNVAPTQPQQGTAQPKPDDIAAQLAAITSMKAQ